MEKGPFIKSNVIDTCCLNTQKKYHSLRSALPSVTKVQEDLQARTPALELHLPI